MRLTIKTGDINMKQVMSVINITEKGPEYETYKIYLECPLVKVCQGQDRKINQIK